MANKNSDYSNNSYIEALCPHCGKSLIDVSKNMGFGIIFKTGKGIIMISPFWNHHHVITDMKIEKGEVVDLYCPHCKHILTTSKKCPQCQAPLAMVIDENTGQKIKFCTRFGCKHHNHK